MESNITIRGLLQDWGTVVDTVEETLSQLFNTIDTLQRKVGSTALKVFQTTMLIHTTAKKWNAILKKEISNYLAGIIGSFIIPAQEMYKGEAAEEVKSQANRYMAKYQRENTSTSLLNKEECIMQDGLALSGVSFTKREVDKWIVFFPGRGENAIWEKALPFLRKLHEESGCNVLCYNYRGVMTDSAATQETVLRDQEEILQKTLFNKGVDPKKVVLHGCGDVGANFVMGVAENLQKKDVTVNICNERSFASIADAVKKFEIPVPLIGRPIAKLISKLGLFFTKMTKWDFDSKKVATMLKGRMIVLGDSKEEASFAKFLQSKKQRLGTTKIIECVEDNEKHLSDDHLHKYTQELNWVFQEA